VKTTKWTKTTLEEKENDSQHGSKRKSTCSEGHGQYWTSPFAITVDGVVDDGADHEIALALVVDGRVTMADTFVTPRRPEGSAALRDIGNVASQPRPTADDLRKPRSTNLVRKLGMPRTCHRPLRLPSALVLTIPRCFLSGSRGCRANQAGGARGAQRAVARER